MTRRLARGQWGRYSGSIARAHDQSGLSPVQPPQEPPQEPRFLGDRGSVERALVLRKRAPGRRLVSALGTWGWVPVVNKPVALSFGIAHLSKLADGFFFTCVI